MDPNIKVEVLLGNQEEESLADQLAEVGQQGADILFVVDDGGKELIFSTDENNMIVGEDGEEYLVLTTGTCCVCKKIPSCVKVILK